MCGRRLEPSRAGITPRTGTGEHTKSVPLVQVTGATAESRSHTLASALERPARWLVGATGGCTYVLGRWVFLRALGLVYLIAFWSLGIQIEGLLGSRGILPATDFLAAVGRYDPGLAHWHLVPSLLWLGASDAALRGVCVLGAIAAVLLVLDVAPRSMLILLWLLYLSLVAVGQDFLSFQWDALLLEAGLLAVLLAPSHWWLRPRGPSPVSPLALLLLWWLLFRLTFASGVVKLTWGDPTWRNLTALDFHYWTQPLPTWTAWYMSQLPEWFDRLSVVVLFVLELGAPLLIFGTRFTRLLACAGVLLLQGMIGATGNYTFFNLLTVVLALLLLDDATWRRLLPHRLVARLSASAPAGRPVGSLLALALGVVLLLGSGAKFLETLAPRRSPACFDRVFAWVDPLRSINGYGLFRVMTTARREIVVEGSEDGREWRAYAFRYKPGEVGRRPRFVEPHQPRLDWQMWFAALGRYEDTRWFEPFLTRLLQGSPAVLGLLANNPFPEHPPRYVRALEYEYRFTTPAERAARGAWWRRRLLGAYSPVLSLGR